MQITVTFTKPKGKFVPISWLIRLFDGFARYSHVALEWDCAYVNVPCAYHASGSNVHLLNKKLFDKKVIRVKKYIFTLNEEEQIKHLSFVYTHAGTTYSQKQILGIFLTKMKLAKSNPFTDGKHGQVCSEVVGRWLLEVKGIDVGSDLDNTGPAQIDKFLERLVECQEVAINQ